MTTTTQTPATTETPAPAKPKGHSFSTVFHGEDGAVLRIITVVKPNGAVMTFALHSVKGADGKNVNQRGATQQHANEAAARKAVEVLATGAAKLGWQRSQRRAGFTARPDAFTLEALPAPKAAKTKKAR